MSRFSDTQGLLLSGYGELSSAAYLMVKIDDPAQCKTVLRQWKEDVTYYDDRHARQCMNLAFSNLGLQRLGVTEQEIQTFSIQFREGMTAPHRSQLLGDLDDNAPDYWRWGQADNVDLVVMLFDADLALLKTRVEKLVAILRESNAGRLAVEPVISEPYPDSLNAAPNREHFGFHDGISQPQISDLAKTSPDVKTFHDRDGNYNDHNILPTGEFVIGYPNTYGKMPASPAVAWKQGTPLKEIGQSPPPAVAPRLVDFGRDGSYIAIRQMHQYVAEFWQALTEATRQSDGTDDLAARELLAAKMVGRWRNGAPLVEHPTLEPSDTHASNSFTFRELDPFGYRCPLGSHIRRANPRDSMDESMPPADAIKMVNRHRILRRGRPYGPWLDPTMEEDEDKERGLMFIAVNTCLERQFEFVQNAWINNPKFMGLYAENDPVVGVKATPDGDRMFTLQAQPVRQRIKAIPDFVRVVGGGYFFLPSRPALEHLLLESLPAHSEEITPHQTQDLQIADVQGTTKTLYTLSLLLLFVFSLMAWGAVIYVRSYGARTPYDPYTDVETVRSIDADFLTLLYKERIAAYTSAKSELRTVIFAFPLISLFGMLVLFDRVKEVPLPFTGVKIPQRWTLIAMPAMLFYLTLQFGFLLHICIDHRAVLYDTITEIENQHVEPSLPAAWRFSLRTQLEDTGFLDTWFLLYRPDQIGQVRINGIRHRMVLYFSLAFYSAILGLGIGFQYSCICETAQFFSASQLVLWAHAITIVSITTCIGIAHAEFFHRHPNELQAIAFSTALVTVIMCCFCRRISFVPRQ